MQDTFEMLQELLEQQQFELLIEECHTTPGDIPLVYLMNDAVESFLVFKQAKLTGSYIKDYEGSLKASLSQEEEQYVLVVWQGDNVVTVFFKDLDLEVRLYNYGEIGHFWVPGYEYLRQLEYRLAIARDKLEYFVQKRKKSWCSLPIFRRLIIAVIQPFQRNTLCQRKMRGSHLNRHLR